MVILALETFMFHLACPPKENLVVPNHSLIALNKYRTEEQTNVESKWPRKHGIEHRPTWVVYKVLFWDNVTTVLRGREKIS